MPRLLEVADLCSRTLSDTANMSRHGSTLCSPTVEKPLCRSPISQRSHVGNLRQTIQGKGEIHKRVETAGVYPLVRPRGVSALPAEVQRKTSRPLGANTPAAVRVPRSAGAEKEPPARSEHAYAVRVPRSAGAKKPPARFVSPIPLCRENEKGTAHAVPLPSTDMSAAQQQQLPQLPQPPQVLSPQVPQEPQPPLP